MRTLFTTKIMTIDGIEYDLELHLDYEVSGKYIAATWYEPEEYPELEFQSLTIVDAGNNSQEIEQGTKLYDAIAEQLDYDKLQDKAWDDADGYAEDYF